VGDGVAFPITTLRFPLSTLRVERWTGALAQRAGVYVAHVLLGASAMHRSLRSSRRSPLLPAFGRVKFLLTGSLLAVSSAGCFGASALPGASATPVAALPLATSSGRQPVCAGRTPQPSNTTWKVKVEGTERAFIVHVPKTYDPEKPTPLVLNFHGFTMTPKLEDWLTDMSAKADAAGFIVVYPEGTGSKASFNAGICCGDAARDNVDDIAFTKTMLDSLEANLCVDSRRVFATGMSNGGFMAHRLACELSDRIAAVAPVAGINGAVACTPARAISVLDFHGTSDPTVPYGGDAKRGWLSAPDSVEGWVKRDGCDEKGITTKVSESVQCVTHDGCRDGAEVSLCTVAGGGHTWPGGGDVPLIAGQGKTNHEVAADDLIWDFFQKHPLPARGAR
jgi:polyhydroxybutyrate depolymerase